MRFLFVLFFVCLFMIEFSVAQVGSELMILISQLVISLVIHHHTLHTPAPPLLSFTPDFLATTRGNDFPTMLCRHGQWLGALRYQVLRD